MSKKSKNAAKLARAAKKRSQKSAEKAKYAAWRDAGANSKRSRIKASKAKRGLRLDRPKRKPTERLEIKTRLPDGTVYKRGLTRKQLHNTCTAEQLRKLQAA
jgi:hypothetical protein